MSNWQPIDTAPKDGTPVLLWVGGLWTTGRWSGWNWEVLETGIGYESDPVLADDPTHWQPLPLGPNGEVPTPPQPIKPAEPWPAMDEIMAKTFALHRDKMLKDLSAANALLQRLMEEEKP